MVKIKENKIDLQLFRVNNPESQVIRGPQVKINTAPKKFYYAAQLALDPDVFWDSNKNFKITAEVEVLLGEPNLPR